jgi:hypothetical protein
MAENPLIDPRKPFEAIALGAAGMVGVALSRLPDLLPRQNPRELLREAF